MDSDAPTIKIKRLKDIDLPAYHHDYDAALDLRAAEETTIEPGTHTIVPTGLAMQIPNGHVGLIWDRSGLAAKRGLHCMAGVIDAGYRGEIGVVMINHGKESYTVEKNERIAQILIQPVLLPKIEEADELDDTSRGEGGFGSTGKR